MDDKIRGIERNTEVLRAQNEEEDQRLSLAQKKALEKEARQRYGKDWKKMIGGALKSIKVDSEAMHTLHSLGMGGQEMRNLNNPALLQRRQK